MTAEAVEYDLTEPCKPFIKWAGGKSQLLPELVRRLPANFNRYFEPFVGGGALYFHLQPAEATLADINSDLINTYTVVRDGVELLIRELQKHRYEKEYFYTLRDVDRRPEFALWGPVRKAARLIYLNKSCFNGLYRVNSKGQFNVPFGKYSNPTICDAPNLKACSRVLAGTDLKVGSFDEITAEADAGDFVYFDPPYAPLSETSSFTSYSKDSFGEEMQRSLFDLCCQLHQRGVLFLLSNSTAPTIRELYSKNPAFKIDTVEASRAINSKGSKRGKISEIMVTNYPLLP